MKLPAANLNYCMKEDCSLDTKNVWVNRKSLLKRLFGK